MATTQTVISPNIVVNFQGMLPLTALPKNDVVEKVRTNKVLVPITTIMGAAPKMMPVGIINPQPEMSAIPLMKTMMPTGKKMRSKFALYFSPLTILSCQTPKAI